LKLVVLVLAHGLILLRLFGLARFDPSAALVLASLTETSLFFPSDLLIDGRNDIGAFPPLFFESLKIEALVALSKRLLYAHISRNEDQSQLRQLTTNNLPAWFRNTHRHSGMFLSRNPATQFLDSG